MIVLSLCVEVGQLVLDPLYRGVRLCVLHCCLHLLQYSPLTEPLAYVFGFRFILSIVDYEGVIDLNIVL